MNVGGFYGTVDLHKYLEKDIASFLKTDDAIVYSDAEATICSVIPSFVKRGDLLIMDDGCADAIVLGSTLARCKSMFFAHNDPTDLKRVLQDIQKGDVRAKRSSDCQRRYVAIEGLFRNTGDITRLPEILKLCKEFCIRLILDESYSIGVLGKTGRGVTEHYGIDIMEVDIICGSLSNTLGSVGGYSTGSQLVVDNQRINSASYVFSASAPPFTSAASSEALRIIQEEPQLVSELQKMSKSAYDRLLDVKNLSMLSTTRGSPMLFLTLPKEWQEQCRTKHGDTWKNHLQDVLEEISKKCVDDGVAIFATRYRHDQPREPLPSLRIVISTHLNEELIQQAVEVLQKAVQHTLSGSLSSKTMEDETSLKSNSTETETPSSKDLKKRRRSTRIQLNSTSE